MSTAHGARALARRRGRAWSIRRRLLASLLAILVVSLAGGPLLSSLLVRNVLESRDEDRLTSVGAAVGGFISGRGDVVMPRERVEELLGRNGTVLVALDEKGVPVAQVDGLGLDATPPAADDLVSAAESLDLGETAQTTSSGRTYVVARTPAAGLVLELDGGARVEVANLVLARDRTDDVALVRRLERSGLAFAIFALVVLGGTAAVVLRRGLRPIEEMADAVQVDDHRTGTELVEERLAVLARGSAVETQRLAEALVGSLAARRTAEEALRAFVADASHELRTPLTTLSGWLDLYAQGGLEAPGERDRAMERMEAEVGRMRLLVEELDLLARLDRGRPLDREPVALAEVLTGVVDDARVVAPDRQVTLACTADPVVLGDRARLEQVFRNLVGNAVQHTPTGTPIEIEVEDPRGSTTGVVVRVVDHGAGIPEAQRTQVFERFHRAGSAREGGSGLGLAIVRALVDAHRGTVTVHPTAGGGATLEVVLPLGGP